MTIEFLKACDYSYKRNYNRAKVDKVITALNKKIQEGEDRVNDALDEVPTLSEKEFEEARKNADKQGWILTLHPDNHDSITYKVTPKEGL